MTDEKGKSPKESAVEARYLLMPHQANPQGTAFGGAIVAWIDMAAAMAAQSLGVYFNRLRLTCWRESRFM